MLKAKGFGISYIGNQRVIQNIDSGMAIFEVEKMNILLAVRSHGSERVNRSREELMTVLVQAETELSKNVQKRSLISFHRSLARQNYDTIIRMAEAPACGIELTDLMRDHCLSCDKGKHIKKSQSKKDTGENPPVDVIGGGASALT